MTLQIRCFDTINSTQDYLEEAIAKGEITGECAVLAKLQTRGRGSRENGWTSKEGNFFASFALKDLPPDLPLQSSALYFGYLFKEILYEYDKKVWLKWPNDLYLGKSKVGGVLSKQVGDFLVIGVGINLQTRGNYRGIDRNLTPETLLEKIVQRFEQKRKWKEIFSKYRLEFDNSKEYCTHDNEQKISMKNARLQSDGSLIIEGKRIFSLR